MELKHSFTVPVPLDRAWDVLLDVERVAPCMPGATLDSVAGDDITGKIKVKVGPIAMTYAGKASFTERNREAGVVTLEASGKETRGAGTASASVRSELTGDGEQTHVTVLTNLNVTGKPAQFGRGVLNEVGGRLIGIFANNLAAVLAADSAGDAAPAAGTADAPVPAEKPAPAETAASAEQTAAAEEAGGQAAAAGTARAAASGPRMGSASAASAAPAAGAAGTDLALPIEELNLPLRAYNSLRREGVHTVGDLVARTPQQLLAIDNIGPASVEDIRQRLAGRGLSLNESPSSANGSGGPATAFPGTPAVPPPPQAPAAPLQTQTTATPLHTVPALAPEAWQSDDDAIDLLSVAGLPVLKRALPVAAGVAAVALIALGLRHRKRRFQR
jgi:carbon monoxide dehydrogenase subunit G